MFYPNRLDINTSEYAQALREQQMYESIGLEGYVSCLYLFALNDGCLISDTYLESPRYKTIALRHGGTVAVYLESIRRGCTFSTLLGVEDCSYKWVDIDSIDCEYGSDDYQRIEANLMAYYKAFLRLKKQCRQTALEAGIPEVPIHPDIQAIIDRALAKPEYAHLRDI